MHDEEVPVVGKVLELELELEVLVLVGFQELEGVGLSLFVVVRVADFGFVGFARVAGVVDPFLKMRRKAFDAGQAKVRKKKEVPGFEPFLVKKMKKMLNWGLYPSQLK